MTTINHLLLLADALADINPNWGYDHMGGGIMAIQRIDDDFQYLIDECEDDLDRTLYRIGRYPAVTVGPLEGDYSMDPSDGYRLDCCLTLDEIIATAKAIDTP